MTFYKRIDFSSSFIESVTTISFIFNSYRMKFYLERIEIVGRKFETFQSIRNSSTSRNLSISKKKPYSPISPIERIRGKKKKEGGGEKMKIMARKQISRVMRGGTRVADKRDAFITQN